MRTLEKQIGAAVQNAPVETDFNQIHHFSPRFQFRTYPNRCGFLGNNCESLVNGISSNGDNERTIQTAYRYLELIWAERAREQAMSEAWRDFPLLRKK